MNLGIGESFKGTTPTTVDPNEQDSSLRSLKGPDAVYKFIFEESLNLVNELDEHYKQLLLNKNFSDLTADERAFLEKHFKVSLTKDFFEGLKSFYNADINEDGKIDAQDREEIQNIEEQARKENRQLTTQEQNRITALNNKDLQKFEAINAVSGQVVHPTEETRN